MKTVLLFISLCLALPVAGVAFYFGNFAVLTWLCVYVTTASLALFFAALRGHGGHEDFELDEV